MVTTNPQVTAPPNRTASPQVSAPGGFLRSGPHRPRITSTFLSPRRTPYRVEEAPHGSS